MLASLTGPPPPPGIPAPGGSGRRVGLSSECQGISLIVENEDRCITELGFICVPVRDGVSQLLLHIPPFRGLAGEPRGTLRQPLTTIPRVVILAVLTPAAGAYVVRETKFLLGHRPRE